MSVSAGKAVGVGALALLLLAGGLALGAAVWQANARTTGGTPGGGDVYTAGKDATTCIAQAEAFTDYPLIFAGASVLGYPLTSCAHRMTKTRHTPDGRVSHAGDDFWHFSYGDCTIPENPHGSETCTLPAEIIIDPCALSVDGRIVQKVHGPTRFRTVRGAQAGLADGLLIFEQSPQIITISAPPHIYLGQDRDAYIAEQEANAVLIAEALVPANAPASAAASALSSDALITATFGATKVACP